MSGVAQATGRGRKHRCAACGVAFYDMERELSACPKCETPYEATAHVPRGEPARKRRSWNKGARGAQPVAEKPAVEPSEDDTEGGTPLLDKADDDEDADVETEAEDDDSQSPKHDEA